MKYIELRVQFENDLYDEKYEMLLVELVMQGFVGFVESGNLLIGYIQANQFSKKNVKEAIAGWEASHTKISWSVTLLEDKNWNEVWEKSFQPVVIEKKCQILAPFHTPDPSIRLQILIEPKMAFGTGHHETTYLMLEEILEHSLDGKRVLDIGCGTGILSIMAAKLGADQVVAIDIDPKSVASCRENIMINQTGRIVVKQSTAHRVHGDRFDLIFANIRTDVILNDMIIYPGLLQESGNLLLSGFEQGDSERIEQKAKENGFKRINQQERNGWIMDCFIKSQNG